VITRPRRQKIGLDRYFVVAAEENSLCIILTYEVIYTNSELNS
jgi:hypothetical protein